MCQFVINQDIDACLDLPSRTRHDFCSDYLGA